MSIAEQICKVLVAKDKWQKELCEDCRMNKFKCDIRIAQDDREREEMSLRFDERREFSKTVSVIEEENF